MREIVKRPRAKEDLKGIWRYSFNEWGEAQADKYLAEIVAGFARLKEHPELGTSRDVDALWVRLHEKGEKRHAYKAS